MTVEVPDAFYRHLRAVIEAQVPAEGECLRDEATCMALHPIHDGGRRDGKLVEVYADVDGLIDVILRALFTPEHQLYLSTGCLHGRHEHCCNAVNVEGQPKQPGTCKFCPSTCVCPCHKAPNSV